MNEMLIAVSILLFIVLLIWVWVKWFQMYNGADGERYMRMRIQGSFVPVDESSDKHQVSPASSPATSGETPPSRLP